MKKLIIALVLLLAGCNEEGSLSSKLGGVIQSVDRVSGTVVDAAIKTNEQKRPKCIDIWSRNGGMPKGDTEDYVSFDILDCRMVIIDVISASEDERGVYGRVRKPLNLD
jgi:hypothetical protein